jgi:hypothetical protein
MAVVSPKEEAAEIAAILLASQSRKVTPQASGPTIRKAGSHRPHHQLARAVQSHLMNNLS